MKFFAALCVLAHASVAIAVPTSTVAQPALWPKNPTNMEQMSLEDLIEFAFANSDQVMKGNMIYNDDNVDDLIQLESIIHQKSSSPNDYRNLNCWDAVARSSLSKMISSINSCQNTVDHLKHLMQKCDDFTSGSNSALEQEITSSEVEEWLQSVKASTCKPVVSLIGDSGVKEISVGGYSLRICTTASPFRKYMLGKGYQVPDNFGELKEALLKKLIHLREML